MRKNLRKSTKKVLVAGATGFVGANLVKRLLANNFSVHILVRKTSNTFRLADIISRMDVHEVDLNESVKLTKIVRTISPDIIFHLATESVYSGKPEDKDTSLLKTNFLGTVNLLSACEGVDYECFINTGSSSEYGPKEKPIRESDLCQPVNIYGVYKCASTLYGQVLAKTQNKPIVALRLFSPYGPFDSYDRLIARAIVYALKNRDLSLTKPDIVRDYVYIDDVVDAYLRCIGKAPFLKGEILNVGSGRQRNIASVLEKIIKLTKSKSRLRWGKLPVSDFEPKIWQADLSKTKRLLSWKPKYAFETGLAKTIDWFKRNLDLYIL